MTAVLMLLLVILNAPQFLDLTGRDGNLLLHSPARTPGKSARPECHLPIRHIAFGRRHLFADRMMDVHFTRHGRDGACPDTYELVSFATALTHQEAFAVRWRSELDDEGLRCPVTVDRQQDGNSSRDLSFVTLDLGKKVSFKGGPQFDCLPVLSIIAQTRTVSLDRQIIRFTEGASYDSDEAAAGRPEIELVSHEPLEDVNVRSLKHGRALTVVLSDHRLGSMLGVLNIVLSALLGVVCAALFSMPGRVP